MTEMAIYLWGKKGKWEFVIHERKKSVVAQSCPTICDPPDSSLPGSSDHGILQAGILEWVAIPFSRGSSWSRDWTQVFSTAGRFFIIWATREALCNTNRGDYIISKISFNFDINRRSRSSKSLSGLKSLNRTFSRSLIMLFNTGNGAFKVTVVLLLALSQISNHARWYQALGAVLNESRHQWLHLARTNGREGEWKEKESAKLMIWAVIRTEIGNSWADNEND